MIPVIEGIAAAAPQVQISVDTMKLAVAAAALEAGASYVNDVSGFTREPEIAELVAISGDDRIDEAVPFGLRQGGEI